ncbi:hypothetical protein Asp14428_63740 [Actinoplanes sp. NBRC 14428]|uniref:Uncharacterized protein DUF3710 n=1 Tax=Pseudosporangium ferrugineum TaxID=439699 RepID=A0A2T0RTZ8_9ACTN|nr:DUF3710 domain-containing protein [Pseudosporangium ferrugineum]PRY24651.1 uncharacterized protein DUF3710 [Pseudosporangium ferrugineum]BCJ54899.1 hypothetical protein Asp14428_63740 [Actinoplanes sp. NBRC 14428]
MFSRKRGGPRHVRPDDAPQSAALAQSMGDLPPAPDFGPWDSAQAPGGIQRLDLGSLLIPAVEGVEVRVQANPDGGVEQIVLVHGNSALQLGVFAAPRSEGIWDEVREEIATAMKSDGAAPREVDGPYGIELTARVNTPDGPADVRFVGVDGPRWMVRALYQGLAAADPSQEGVLGDCLRGLVVVRDNEARPVREALPLRLPREMAQAAEEHAHDHHHHEDPTPPDVAPNQQAPGVNGRHAR